MCYHRSNVTPRPCEARDNPKGPTGDEWNDTERGPAGSLHEERKDDHNTDGGTQSACATEDNAKNASKRLDDPKVPETAPHAESSSQQVGDDPTARAGDEVHEPEQGGDQTCLGEVHSESVVEVLRDDVVNRQLHSEAVAVCDEEYPRTVVCHCVQENLQEDIHHRNA